MTSPRWVFSTVADSDIAGELTAQLQAQGVGAERGELETRRFPDGERYLRLKSRVRDHDVVLVGGTVDDTSTLELFDLACGLVAEGCRSLKLILPFFGYSTMERAVKPGEVVTAKTRARLLSAIPTAPFGNEIWLIDLHSEGIPFYFEGNVKTRHLYAKPLILAEAQRLAGNQPFCFGAPDAGRAKWVESLANELGVQAAFVYKRRKDDGTVERTGVNLPALTSHVILYDDMVRTGGSILQAAQAFRQAGASSISLIATHGLFCQGAEQKLLQSGLFAHVSVTDSHPKARQLPSDIRVLPLAPLLAARLVETWSRNST